MPLAKVWAEFFQGAIFQNGRHRYTFLIISQPTEDKCACGVLYL